MKDKEHNQTHRNCRNFAPVDVGKGICHLSKKMVSGDDPSCDKFARMPKCHYCKNFDQSPEEPELGICLISQADPKFPAFADMVATTCKDFLEN